MFRVNLGYLAHGSRMNDGRMFVPNIIAELDSFDHDYGFTDYSLHTTELKCGGLDW